MQRYRIRHRIFDTLFVAEHPIETAYISSNWRPPIFGDDLACFLGGRTSALTAQKYQSGHRISRIRFLDSALLHPVCEVGWRRIVALRDELLGGDPLASSASIVNQHSTVTPNPRPTATNLQEGDRWGGAAGPVCGDEPSQFSLCRSFLVAFPSLHDEKEILQPAEGVNIRRRFASSGVILASFSTLGGITNPYRLPEGDNCVDRCVWGTR